MRKVWLCIFYALCIFTIVFSLFWMALPSLPFPADSGEETPASEPGLAAQGSAGQSGTDFYLCDEGDRKSTRLNSSHASKSRMPSSA